MLTKHITLAIIVLVVACVYYRVPGTYFCGYDDFLEVHRAAFEDTANPARVYTTTHFESYKYRPLNRALNLITFWWDKDDATLFRLRNVVFHLLNVVLVYLLAWTMFRRFSVSAAAALLFGLHPLSNQAVVGSVMTNTAAHACVLLSLLLFLFSLSKTRAWCVWLVLTLLIGFVSTLLYETGIIVYPLMITYIVLRWIVTRERVVDRRYWLVLLVGTAICIGSYFFIRSTYVPYSASKAVPGIKTMIKSTVMYVAALGTPVDWVMANEWFGTPLPSQLSLRSIGMIKLAAVLAAAMFLLIVAAYAVKKFVRIVPRKDITNVLFLIVCIGAVIGPLILLTEKPSETYLYLPVAFSAILFAMIMFTIMNNRTLQRVAVGITLALAVTFALGTWVRNNRVRRCGDTARQIVNNLKQERIQKGLWFLWLAAAPDEPQLVRYGMYGWSNVYTLGETGVQPAAQLINHNPQLAATVVEPIFFLRNCYNPRYICLTVHNDGRVEQVGASGRVSSQSQ